MSPSPITQIGDDGWPALQRLECSKMTLLPLRISTLTASYPLANSLVLLRNVSVQPPDEQRQALSILASILPDAYDTSARRSETGRLLEKTAHEVLAALQLIASDRLEVVARPGDRYDVTSIDSLWDHDASTPLPLQSDRLLEHSDRKQFSDCP